MDIGELLAFGVKNGASDLHLSAGLPPMIRVDGDVHVLAVEIEHIRGNDSEKSSFGIIDLRSRAGLLGHVNQAFIRHRHIRWIAATRKAFGVSAIESAEVPE